MDSAQNDWQRSSENYTLPELTNWPKTPATPSYLSTKLEIETRSN